MNHELHLPGSTMPRCKHCNKTWMHLQQTLGKDPTLVPCLGRPKIT